MAGERTGERVDGAADDGRYRHLIEHVQDAVVEFTLVDGEPIVGDVNRAFVDVFGYDADEIRGESLNAWVVPDWKIAEARELDANTASGEINYRQVARETATGLREFLYRGVPYAGDEERDEAPRGGFAVYTDLTEVSRNERRLEVLNRILRHNLRNNANVVAGHTTRLLAELDDQRGESVDVAATIERAAHELERLAEEANHIRRVLEHPTDEPADIDPEPTVRSVVADYRERTPSAEIEIETSVSRPVMADSRLRYAIDSLVDNAIEHNPSPEPRVRVRIGDADPDPNAASGEWVAIHVEDDGPRIPADERDVIRDGSAITPTHHGSGLGLWLAELTVETFGGELSFGESDLGGNDVSIRLRRR
ncbi:PAS domain-containing sensor histidine kinase [Halorubrum sp. GN11_10-6_MGM]|uniref:PAS domain-containing sensor histidine kinase n=1 Tax=Halorubrum sp. GN11_10-6_MGM TaxID=2518112 RepID=UPI0010F4419E|nr:PAS domain-containing sensor histidine kinase [Halorubrum sp. GN11_10-6_MGM]TKX73824.1 PAS domain-containing sensor histidine kinase [Halorubrum sp. GN11_10-6_MGM]